MNLEKFPSNEMARKMMETITGNGFYDRSYIGKWIFQVMGQEIEAAIKYIDELPEQAFPKCATWGIGYQELKYGIPENAGMTLEERRNQLMVWKILSPMNPMFLERQIGLIIGHDRVEVTENNTEYAFRVEISETDNTAASYPDVRKFVRKVKPSHLSLLIVGRYGSEFSVNIEHDNSCLHMISGFYPRNNLQWLLLDGTWDINGEQMLNGYKAGAMADFYPERLSLVSGCKTEVSSGGRLRVEVDLWYLDGTVVLDGSRSLKSEVIEYSDEEL